MKNNNKMRIVGLNSKDVFIQVSNGRDWTQIKVDRAEFKNLMITEFPSYWDEFTKSGRDPRDFADFFYMYGYENGETFVFTKGEAIK